MNAVVSGRVESRRLTSMESSHKSVAGPNMLIVLGISAIDVLCCALVCSLVLFLMLSQARSSGAAIRGTGNNKDLLIAFEVPVAAGTAKDDWPVLRVRVFEPTPNTPKGVGDGTPLLSWGHERAGILPKPT